MAAKGVTALCLLRPNLPLTRLTRKSEIARVNCCHLRAIEKNRAQSISDRGVFLKLTKIFPVSSGKICEHISEVKNV